MKRFFAIAICLAMLLPLCACSSDAPPAAEAPIQSSAPTSAPAEPSPVESPQPSQTPEVRLPEGCRLYYELFTFSAEGVTGNIEHNAMNGRWKISTSADVYENMEATEADGILSLSDGSSVWKFHRQGDDLVYDGGENASAVPELQPGQLIERSDASFLYHMVPYILDLSAIEAREDVSGLEAARARLIFDTENKRFVLYDEFGNKQEGVFNCDGQRIRLHYGQSDMTGRIEDHGLVINSSFFFSPMYVAVNSSLYFNPLPELDAVAEGLEFSIDYAPAVLPETSCLPLTEEYLIYSQEDGFSFDSPVVLCPRESRFTIGTYGTDFGSYTEEDGKLVLTSEEHEYIFRREGDGLIQTGGDPLYLDGNVYQGMWGISVELPMGCTFPLYSRNCLRSGTYQLENEGHNASISVDLEAMTCTLLTTDGKEYESPIEIDMNRIRMEIPEGAFFLFASSVDGIRVSNLLDAVTIAPELDVSELYFKFAG